MKFSIPTQVAMIVIVLIAVTWWEGSAAATQSPSVLAFAALIAAVCFWYFYSCTPRKFGLTCSACNESLVRHRSANRYLDQGLCPWCKDRFWSDREHGTDAFPEQKSDSFAALII